MPRLFGKEYSRTDLLRRVGDIQQIAGVQLFEYLDGAARGVRALEFRTGTGFRFVVLPDRALDIPHADYQGNTLSYLSPTGVVGPWYYEPEGLGWLRSFFAGLLTTCGLTHVLFPQEDDASQYHYPPKQTEQFGLHGRISNTPAELTSYGGRWEGEDYVMWAEGRVREAAVFGENLSLTRRIETRLGENRFWIRDRVENLGFSETPHMCLYHINIGFPLVDVGAELVSPSRRVTPWGESAEAARERYRLFDPPTPSAVEQVFSHEMVADEDGYVYVGCVNRAFGGDSGLGLYVRYRLDQFPFYCQWRTMGEGIYAMALEPSTNSLEGRAADHEAGRLRFLKPLEVVEYDLEVGVLVGQKEIKRFVGRVQSIHS